MVPSILNMKTLIQNLGLANTALNKLLIISNKRNGLLLKIYHIFKLRGSFATAESLKSDEISDACSSSKFELKTHSSKCQPVSNYVAVTLQLYIVKNGEFKEGKIIAISKI